VGTFEVVDGSLGLSNRERSSSSSTATRMSSAERLASCLHGFSAQLTIGVLGSCRHVIEASQEMHSTKGQFLSGAVSDQGGGGFAPMRHVPQNVDRPGGCYVHARCRLQNLSSLMGSPRSITNRSRVARSPVSRAPAPAAVAAVAAC